MERTCEGCNQSFDVSEFKHRRIYYHLCNECNEKRKRKYVKKYNRSEKHRKSQKKYSKTPNGQKRIEIYQRDYAQRPYVKKRKADWERKMYQTNPQHRINNIMRVSIGAAIKDKNNRSWPTLVGYSSDDLKTHLEKQFREGMTWDNHGKAWEIDHVMPRSMFKYESFEDEDFIKCWCLQNLQPRWATTKIAEEHGDFEMIGNSNKGARFIG